MKRSFSSCLGSIVVLFLVLFLLGKAYDALTTGAKKAGNAVASNGIVQFFTKIWYIVVKIWDVVVGGTARLLHINQFLALILLLIIGAFLFSDKKNTTS